MVLRSFLLFFTTLSLFAAEPSRFGNIRGDLQLFSYSIDGDRARANAAGGLLGYRTPSRYAFGLSVEGAFSHRIGESKAPERTKLFENDAEASAIDAVNEAFLFYRDSRTFIRIGAQSLNTPLLNTASARIVPWSYCGLGLLHTLQDGPTIEMAALSKIRRYNEERFESQSASGELARGLYYMGISDKTDPHHYYLAYYYHAPMLYDALYLQYDYNRPVEQKALYCMGIQYIRTFRRGGADSFSETGSAAGGDDVNLIGLKVSVDYLSYFLQASYSQNFGDSGIDNGYGGLSKVFTSSMIANGRKNSRPRTFALKSEYRFDPTFAGNSDIAVQWTQTDYRDETREDFSALYLHLKNRFTINHSAQIRYEHIRYNGIQAQNNHLRIIYHYRF